MNLLSINNNSKSKHTDYKRLNTIDSKDKEATYESHEGCLARCYDANIIPKDLLLELKPTIGDHDQEFLDNCYSKLKSFSVSMMEDIVKFWARI